VSTKGTIEDVNNILMANETKLKEWLKAEGFEDISKFSVKIEKIKGKQKVKAEKLSKKFNQRKKKKLDELEEELNRYVAMQQRYVIITDAKRLQIETAKLEQELQEKREELDKLISQLEPTTVSQSPPSPIPKNPLEPTTVSQSPPKNPSVEQATVKNDSPSKRQTLDVPSTTTQATRRSSLPNMYQPTTPGPLPPGKIVISNIFNQTDKVEEKQEKKTTGRITINRFDPATPKKSNDS